MLLDDYVQHCSRLKRKHVSYRLKPSSPLVFIITMIFVLITTITAQTRFNQRGRQQLMQTSSSPSTTDGITTPSEMEQPNVPTEVHDEFDNDRLVFRLPRSASTTNSSSSSSSSRTRSWSWSSTTTTTTTTTTQGYNFFNNDNSGNDNNDWNNDNNDNNRNRNNNNGNNRNRNNNNDWNVNDDNNNNNQAEEEEDNDNPYQIEVVNQFRADDATLKFSLYGSNDVNDNDDDNDTNDTDMESNDNDNNPWNQNDWQQRQQQQSTTSTTSRTPSSSSFSSSTSTASHPLHIVNVTHPYPRLWKFQLSDNTTIKVHKYPINRRQPDGEMYVYSFTWNVPWNDHDDARKVCFHTHHNNASWYSSYEQQTQDWPMNGTSFLIGNNSKDQPFITGFDGGWGAILEHLFLNTDGFGLLLYAQNPLFIIRRTVHSNNDTIHQLCITNHNRPPYPTDAGFASPIKFTIFTHTDIRNIFDEIHQSRLFISKPTNIPDVELFKAPIWSTWVPLRRQVNQQSVLQFARNISTHGFNVSRLVIEDGWERNYGDLQFDTEKFFNITQLINTLHMNGIRVSLWIHPFVNQDSDRYPEVVESGFCIQHRNNSNRTDNEFNQTMRDSSTTSNPSMVPFPVSWWNGDEACELDFSSRDTQTWFLNRLRKLREDTGIDSYKFDAGEVSWLTTGPMVANDATIDGMDGDNYQFHCDDNYVERVPNLLTKYYVDANSELGPDVIQEFTVGYKTQQWPSLVRMVDRASIWDASGGGLRSVIPTALTMSLGGYYFILPDMIGGNAYRGQSPSYELFIRWIQVVTFMPVMQFSLPPWHFVEEATSENQTSNTDWNRVTNTRMQMESDNNGGDDGETWQRKVVNITKKFIALHRKFAPMIVSLAKETSHGAPIIRPMWYIEPNDTRTYAITDQFMLGNDLVVAPVVNEGERQRSVYLPSGRWRDARYDDVMDHQDDEDTSGSGNGNGGDGNNYNFDNSNGDNYRHNEENQNENSRNGNRNGNSRRGMNSGGNNDNGNWDTNNANSDSNSNNENSDNNIYQGPMVLQSIDAPLDVLPYFVRVNDTNEMDGSNDWNQQQQQQAQQTTTQRQQRQQPQELRRWQTTTQQSEQQRWSKQNYQSQQHQMSHPTTRQPSQQQWNSQQSQQSNQQWRRQRDQQQTTTSTTTNWYDQF